MNLGEWNRKDIIMVSILIVINIVFILWTIQYMDYNRKLDEIYIMIQNVTDTIEICELWCQLPG